MKYYYSDVLKAQWMTREFGFKIMSFYYDDFDPVKYEHIIAESCHEMLKPQVGDLLLIEDAAYKMDYWAYTDGVNSWREGQEPTYGPYGKIRKYAAFSMPMSGSYCDAGKHPIIIQRNGAAFFTPEIEG